MEKKITRRGFIACAAGAGALMLLPADVFGAAAGAKWDKKGMHGSPWPWVAARADGTVRILALTDLHFFLQGMLVDPETLRDIRRMVRHFQPDMIAVTGDMWHNNPDGRGLEFCKWACTQMMKFKTPWAFAWGNHDMMDDYARGHRMLESAPWSLYKGLAGDGNYRVEVRSPDSTVPLWNLIFLNASHTIGDAQLEWFEREAAAIARQTPGPPPAFLFFHIPLRQYLDLAERGLARGVMLENVCYDGESGKALRVFSKYKWVRAIFCGHDHVNDYEGVIDGVHLEYLRATGIGGYGGDKVRKGGTLITADLRSGSFDSISVLPGGETWAIDTFLKKQAEKPY